MPGIERPVWILASRRIRRVGEKTSKEGQPRHGQVQQRARNRGRGRESCLRHDHARLQKVVQGNGESSPASSPPPSCIWPIGMMISSSPPPPPPPPPPPWLPPAAGYRSEGSAQHTVCGSPLPLFLLEAARASPPCRVSKICNRRPGRSAEGTYPCQTIFLPHRRGPRSRPAGAPPISRSASSFLSLKKITASLPHCHEITENN